uniref:Uncharacterized protein LOC102807825 n=1 Tax=Saccoglossus kowalevskii TaxID=10224 RepID=A0ABM0N073_SACKO|nr:PREDICTED: uncharacterized protein LOC102807825 [Saccoglossus kowalevskii]
MHEQVSQLHHSCLQLRDTNRRLNEENLKMQRYSRSFNLRFGGVHEIEGEDCLRVAKQILQSKFGMENAEIENAQSELTQPVHTFAPSDVRLGTATDVMTRDNEGDTYGISEAWQTGIIVAVVLFSALVMIVTGFLGWFLPKSQIIPSASSSRHMERIHRNNTPRRQGGYMSLLKKRLLERITENNLNSRRDLNDVKKFVHKNNIPMPDFTAARRLNNGTFYGRDTTYISISKRNGIAYLEMIRPEGAPVPSRLKRCNIELEQVAMRSDNETVQGEPQLLPPLPPSPPPSPSPSPPPPPSSSSPPSASPSPLPTPSPPSPQQLEQSPPTAQRSEEHSQDQSEQQPVAEQRQQQSEPQ